MKYCFMLLLQIIVLLISSSTAAYAGSGAITYSEQNLFTIDTGFSTQRGVSVNSDGNIYVASDSSDTISIFDSSGNFIRQLGSLGSGPGELTDPLQVFIDENDIVYVADQRNNRVQAFDKNDNLVQTYNLPGGVRAFGVIKASNDQVYVTTANSNMYIFDLAGNQLGTVSQNSIVAEQIDQGADGNLYVAGHFGGRDIKVFDLNGNFLGDIPVASGTNPDQIDSPIGLQIDDFGNIYVTEFNQDVVKIFDSAGNLLYQLGLGELNEPVSIYQDDNGRVYISNRRTREVKVIEFSSTEEFTSSPLSGDETATTPLAHLKLRGSNGHHTFSDNFLNYDTLEIDASGGSWTLSGTSSFDDTLTVTAGTLVNNGTLSTTNGSTFAAGSTYAGTGTLNSDVVFNGAVAAGNSNIGKLNINGDVTFNSGSTLDIDIDPTNSDMLDVTGNVTINGGDVIVTAENSQSYAPSRDYAIINSTGFVAGTFNSVTNNFAFLDFDLKYTSSSVLLNVKNNNATLTSFARTENQQNVAQALEKLFASGNPDALIVQNAVLNLTTNGVDRTLNQVNSQKTSSLTVAHNAASSGFKDNIVSRIIDASSPKPNNFGGFFNKAALMQTSLRQDNLYTQHTQKEHNTQNWAFGMNDISHDFVGTLWGKGFIGVGNIDGDANAGGYRHETIGTTLGIDRPISIAGSNWLVGVAAGMGYSKIDYDGGSDQGEVDYYRFSLYGDGPIFGNAFDLSIQTGYTLSHHDLTRNINIGALRRQANADFYGHRFSLSTTLSHTPHVWDNWSITPFASFDAGFDKQESYRETGAGSLNLNVDSLERYSIKPGVGLTIQTTQKWGKKYEVEPYATLHIQHELGDNQSVVNSAFAVTPSNSFQTRGFSTNRTSYTATLGAQWQPAESEEDGPSYTANLSTTQSGDTSNFSLTTGIKWVW